jgi:hypothetical protein
MEVVKKSDIVVVVREYEKEGAKKKVYKNIGEITTFKGDDGTYFSKVELWHMPGAQISVFEQKERTE